MTTAIILGTSRDNGNTSKLVKLYMKYNHSDLFNLNDYVISTYDYAHLNKNDDFLVLAKSLKQYDHIVFASPIYWYSMSAQMKVFFDRLSDLLTIEKPLGRAFKGKTCSLLSTGVDKEIPECFIAPFQLTANYLGLEFIDAFYCSCSEEFINQEHNDNLLSYLGDSVDNNIDAYFN